MQRSLATVLVSTLALCATLLGSSALAQAPKASPAQLEAMQKLDWLVGNWRGEAEIHVQPGQVQKIKQAESIQRKHGGALLLIEGTGSIRPPGQDVDVTVFEALAVITYDEANKRYRFHAHTGGHYSDAQATVSDGRIEWRLPRTTQGETRYTIQRTETGDWHEIGERSTDGVTWRKFIELKLKKLIKQ